MSKTNDRMGKVFVSLLATFVAVGAYLSGYSIGSVNGLQNFSGLLETFGLINENSSTNLDRSRNSSNDNGCMETSDLSHDQLLVLGAMVSLINLGGFLGALLAGKPTDYAGRKVTLLTSGVFVIMGGALQAAAFTSWIFMIGRLTSGIGNGLFYMAGPVYISEIAPKNIRGTLTSLIGPTIALGLLTGSLTNIGLAKIENGWRISGLLLCLFGSIYTVGLAFLPETPRWLVFKKRDVEARAVLDKLMDSNSIDDIENEIAEIKNTLNNHTGPSCLRDFKLFLKWINLKRVLLGIPLHFLTAASGTVIYFYSEPLLCSLGILPFITSIIIGLLTLFATIFSSGLVDKLGRKTILVSSGFFMAVFAGAAATLILVFNLEEEGNVVVGYIVVVFVCLFMFVYSSSWYVIPWVVTGEIFPLEVRGIAVAISTGTNWITTYILTQSFPLIISVLNSYGSLYFLAGIDIMAALFYLFLLPETKGVSLEEMELLFDKPWLKRVNLFHYLRCGCFCSQRKKKVIQLPDGLMTNPNKLSDSVCGEKVENFNHHLNKDDLLTDDQVWNHYWEGLELEANFITVGKETSV